MTSKHWTQDRQKRQELINKIGQGDIIKTVEVNRGHKDGPEIHKISNTGIISIFNKKSQKLITCLIARPSQIKRYYKENETIPNALIKIAKEHQKLKLNYV